MPELTMEELTIGLAVAAGLAVLAFLTVLFLALRLRRVRKEYSLLRGKGENQDILSVLGQVLRELEGVNNRVGSLEGALEDHRELARSAIQRFGLVRYDAFEDMGGRMSFSAALLDDQGDGLILTSINGRTETRTYAKPVVGMDSSYNLSDEEREALALAKPASSRKEAQPAGRPR